MILTPFLNILYNSKLKVAQIQLQLIYSLYSNCFTLYTLAIQILIVHNFTFYKISPAVWRTYMTPHTPHHLHPCLPSPPDIWLALGFSSSCVPGKKTVFSLREKFVWGILMEQEKIVWWEMEGMVRMVCTVTEKNLPLLIVVVVRSELKHRLSITGCFMGY